MFINYYVSTTHVYIRNIIPVLLDMFIFQLTKGNLCASSLYVDVVNIANVSPVNGTRIQI